MTACYNPVNQVTIIHSLQKRKQVWNPPHPRVLEPRSGPAVMFISTPNPGPHPTMGSKPWPGGGQAGRPGWAPRHLKLPVLSCSGLFATPQTVAHQDSPSMEISRQEYWSGLPFPSPGDLPNPGIKPKFPVSPALTGRIFTTSATWDTSSEPEFSFALCTRGFLMMIAKQVRAMASLRNVIISVEVLKVWIKSRMSFFLQNSQK